MSSATEPYADRRRPVDRFLGNYSEDHRNPTNRLVHWVCVPLIVWSVIALLWVIPVPPGIGRPGLWAGIALVFASMYYIKLSMKLAIALVVFFAVLMGITHLLHGALGARGLLWSAIGVFVLAWVAQFIGHQIEGKRPSFLTDLVYLLVGPMWLMSKIFRRFGVSY